MSKAMYVLVNKKLTKSQRIPQASHAVAEFMHFHGNDQSAIDWVQNDKTMVCLAADEETMESIMDKVFYDEKAYRPWTDEDLKHKMWFASVAFEPMSREDGVKYFSELSLA